ncbi:pheromone receptor transcription factor-like [Pistacia vera]|uniref:pheromone receptor transcription factor-like n=1 Tax=Pistacia vera TaxID=55513 RepID=UPI001262F9BD|nr:pheromone receptor transcription factor-like [Pistacia vera]
MGEANQFAKFVFNTSYTGGTSAHFNSPQQFNGFSQDLGAGPGSVNTNSFGQMFGPGNSSYDHHTQQHGSHNHQSQQYQSDQQKQLSDSTQQPGFKVPNPQMQPSQMQPPNQAQIQPSQMKPPNQAFFAAHSATSFPNKSSFQPTIITSNSPPDPASYMDSGATDNVTSDPN